MEIPQGKYETLSYDAMLASIKEELGIESSDHDFGFERLINKCVRRIDSLNIFSKQECKLKVVHGMAKLPCGFNKLLGLRGDKSCLPFIYVDMPFIRGCGCDNTRGLLPFANAFEIQDTAIVFHQQFKDQFNEDNDEVRLSYFGLNLNSDGLMQIYVDMEDAIVAYVAWKYGRRNYNEMPRDVRADYKSEWIAQKKWLRSVAFYDNFQETKTQISEWNNALIVDKAPTSF